MITDQTWSQRVAAVAVAVIVDGTVTEQERQNMEGYLARKWG